MPIFSRLRRFTNLEATFPSLAGMMMFWAIFDGMLMYVAPIVFEGAGLTNTEIGLVLSSSSVFGALFDILISKLVKNPHYRRLYFIFFICCAAIPLILSQAKTIPFFVLIMALWGIYFDFVNFGNLDFVSRLRDPQRSTFLFSVLMVFKSVGYVIAPILAGLIITDVVTNDVYWFMWLVLGIAFLFYLYLYFQSKRHPEIIEEQVDPNEQKTFAYEVIEWRKLIRIIWSPLLFTILFCIYDSFFFTIGPLLAESYNNIQPLNGLMLAAYSIPTLLFGMFTVRIARRFGKRRTTYVSLMLAALPLCAFGFVTNPIILIALIFISGIFSSFCIPTLESIFADYIDEAREFEEEIQSVGDFMNNWGYVIGPILAGFLADQIGFTSSFSILGLALLIALVVLIKITPQKIQIAQAMGIAPKPIAVSPVTTTEVSVT